MTDVVDRLKELTRLKHGDPLPAGWERDWATPLNALLTEAIAEIEWLRHHLANETARADRGAGGQP